MPDKVKPLKIESSVHGSEDDWGQTETDPTEDYLAAKGIAFENSDGHLLHLKDGEVAFKDPVSGERKLSQYVDKAGNLLQLVGRSHTHLQNINSGTNVKHVTDNQKDALDDAVHPLTSGNVVVDTQHFGNALDTVRENVNVVRSNQMINSLEIQALKETDINPDLSCFVDSFDDEDLMDPESSNYEINQNEGYVNLNQGGEFTAKDTTESQFNEGTFVSGEAFLDVGGDGAIRKEQVVAGGITVQEDFEDISNVVTTGSATQSHSNTAGTVQEGSYSLCINIDFSGSSLSESSVTTVDLGASGVDLSTNKYLNLYFLKTESSNLKYDIQLEDTTTATYDYAQATLPAGSIYQKIQKLINTATGIDKTSIRYIRFRVYEQSTGQVILDVAGSTGPQVINPVKSGNQTFIADSNYTCQRIRIRARQKALDPDAPLYVAVANYFGTTLGIASIPASQATASFQDFYLTLDNPFNLIQNETYSILVETPSTEDWEIEIAGSVYANGSFYLNGGDTGKDMNFTLYTPAVVESIYIDDLNVEAASTYQQIGTFISRGINLGIVPDTLDKLYWTEEGSNDTVRARIRFATTEGELSSASWSSYFTDASGVTNNLTGVTPNQWYQYEIDWSGGTTSDTDIVREINLDYSAAAGSGNAIIISVSESTSAAPTTFMIIIEEETGTGTSNYYISRDGKSTWQSILSDDLGEEVSFTSGSGTQLHLKAILTGNAKLYGWALICDEEFV